MCGWVSNCNMEFLDRICVENRHYIHITTLLWAAGEIQTVRIILSVTLRPIEGIHSSSSL